MAIYEDLSNFIWQIADFLRGPYRPPQYERVMLPLTVLRRFDSVLRDSHEAVCMRYEQLQGRLDGEALDSALNQVAGHKFHNHSRLTFETLATDPDRIQDHLTGYIRGFSSNVQLIFDRFDFFAEVQRMHEANILFLIVSNFARIDLHPSRVDTLQMGLLFEDLVRRFNEQANETAGDHFTPREVDSVLSGR
jgi:type I restriction enzyme M protein